MSTLSPFREDVEVAAATETAPGYAEAPYEETWYAPEVGSSPLAGGAAEHDGAEPEGEAFDFGEAEAEAAHPILALFPLPPAVLEALSNGLSSVAVGLAANAGYRDVDKLTNIVFYFRHPDVIGRKIRPEERELAAEWISIRDRVVKPALQANASGLPAASPAPPVTIPPTAIPAVLSPERLSWPGHSQEELDFMKAVYIRHSERSRSKGGDFVMDLPKSALAPIEGREARKDAAAAVSKLLDEARIALAREHPEAQIGIVSAYRPATLQFTIWQGRDPSDKDKGSGFPYYYREAIQKGIVRAGDYSSAAVDKVAQYLGGYVASPGYSNHQDGLAFDFGTGLQGKRLGKLGWNSWFRKWLEQNAARHHFVPLSTEAWHWTYHPPSGAQEIWAGELEVAATPVRAGSVSVPRVPMLARHRGSPPDLILHWNEMASVPDEIDVAVHLHGFWYDRMRLDRDIEPVSGLDLVPVKGESGQGRTRPTLAVLPRGHNTGVKQAHGPYTAYTFPALVTPMGLTDLLRVALDRFAAEGGGSAPRVGRLILTAHSGGGKALLQILQSPDLEYHDPHQVHVFDALYWPPDALVAWARRRARKDREAIAAGASVEEYMATQGGGLRVFYQGRYQGGTRPNSLSVRYALAPDVDATLARWYRVEASKYDHFQIPRLYGFRVLADVSADVPNAYVEQTRSREAEFDPADSEAAEFEAWQEEADEEHEDVAALPETEEDAAELFGAAEVWEGEAEGVESPEVERGDTEDALADQYEAEAAFNTRLERP